MRTRDTSAISRPLPCTCEPAVSNSYFFFFLLFLGFPPVFFCSFLLTLLPIFISSLSPSYLHLLFFLCFPLFSLFFFANIAIDDDYYIHTQNKSLNQRWTTFFAASVPYHWLVLSIAIPRLTSDWGSLEFDYEGPVQVNSFICSREVLERCNKMLSFLFRKHQKSQTVLRSIISVDTTWSDR